MSALDEIVKDLIGEYDAGNLEDASLAPVIKRIREGKATYGDVERLASRTGTRAGRLIAEQLAALSVDGRVTEEQARAVLMGLTSHNYDVVSGAAADVQESLNRRAGLGLKAVRPEFNRDRVEGLITEVVGKEDVPAFKNTLVQQVENVSVATVDDSVKVNAKAHYNAGLSPKIVRVTDGKCCKWCDALAGVHEYSQVNNTGNDVFRRHANCGCQILYDPGDGKKWQDVHSKRLLSAAESDKIRVRIRAGLTERGDMTNGSNGSASVSNPSNRKGIEQVVLNCKNENIAYEDVQMIAKKEDEREIIKKIAGGDKTAGSCQSLALAYAGNKAGYDVRDFRGGKSCDFFSETSVMRTIANGEGVRSFTIKEYDGYKSALNALKLMEPGKEYIFSAGRHTTIVRRKKPKGIEYLELQSPLSNGFKNLTSKELKDRFGVTKQRTTYGIKLEQESFLIDIESLANDGKFKELLGYINTLPGNEIKGVTGHVK